MPLHRGIAARGGTCPLRYSGSQRFHRPITYILPYCICCALPLHRQITSRQRTAALLQQRHLGPTAMADFNGIVPGPDPEVQAYDKRQRRTLRRALYGTIALATVGLVLGLAIGACRSQSSQQQEQLRRCCVAVHIRFNLHCIVHGCAGWMPRGCSTMAVRHACLAPSA